MPPSHRRRGGWLSGDRRFGYLSIFPALVLMTVFSTGPLVYAFVLSLQRYKLAEAGLGRPFNYGENYADVVGSGFFLPSLINTLIFTLGAVVIIFLIALTFTLVLNEAFRGSIWIRLALLVPWATPEIANALAWRWIFDANWGVWNGLTVHVFYLFDIYQSWMGHPNYAMGTILAPHIWREVSLATILLLAGISTIPGSLYEAAKLDGANIFARFKRITLPMLKPIIQLVLVYETILALASFAYVFILTGGGPGYVTTTLSWLIFVTSFNFADFGQGSAVAVIMSAIAIFLIVLYFRLLPTRQFGSVTVR